MGKGRDEADREFLDVLKSALEPGEAIWATAPRGGMKVQGLRYVTYHPVGIAVTDQHVLLFRYNIRAPIQDRYKIAESNWRGVKTPTQPVLASTYSAEHVRVASLRVGGSGP